MEWPVLEYLPLAREFGVAEWESRVLGHLVSRKDPLTEHEIKALGEKLTAATAARREDRLRNRQEQPQLPPAKQYCGVQTSFFAPSAESNDDSAHGRPRKT
ncbi:hypothetical protein FRC07_004593, partial [Ceratobasidium sp. 392]